MRAAPARPPPASLQRRRRSSCRPCRGRLRATARRGPGPLRHAPAASGRLADDGAPYESDDVVPIEMEGDGPLVVREKFHPARPMAIDQALYEMELVGHDFFLFRDAHDGCPSVVYRRRGYQYGVIRLVEELSAGRAASPPQERAARANGLAGRTTDVASG